MHNVQESLILLKSYVFLSDYITLINVENKCFKTTSSGMEIPIISEG
tara:strand:- start:77 stop:217 length:141 start_codon:yes stop_codon:yes gene_type:complete